MYTAKIRSKAKRFTLPCKAKRQYLLTCKVSRYWFFDFQKEGKVSRYCLLDLQGRVHGSNCIYNIDTSGKNLLEIAT